MKLKDNMVTQDLMDEQFLIALGDSPFKGMIRSNPTAAFIVNLLKNDTSIGEIVDAVYEEYDADRETIEADVRNVIEMLRSARVIEE